MAADTRWGVLGGTFDPPHRAHRALAEAARDQLGLDRVLLVVAADPWQKRGDVEAPAVDRLAMAEALARGGEKIEASALEIERGGPSYTAETLEDLEAPGRELVVVLGADAADRLDTWERSERVRELATIAVADRAAGPDGFAVVDRLRAQGWRCEVVDLPAVDISSTEIRERRRRGEAVDDVVPPQVVRVIEERDLYTRS